MVQFGSMEQTTFGRASSRGWADLYAWQLDRASRTPLSRQIYMQVRSAVLSGALRAGARMPSSRAMASKLGVARASVVAAYEQLLAEGYVESRHGSGTFISDDIAGLATRRRVPPRASLRALLEPNWICGNKAVQQWQRTATTRAGEVQDWIGCDLLTFEGCPVKRAGRLPRPSGEACGRSKASIRIAA
jgi:DNA-binding transcriptional regulator YhcF (GntR family)